MNKNILSLIGVMLAFACGGTTADGGAPHEGGGSTAGGASSAGKGGAAAGGTASAGGGAGGSSAGGLTTGGLIGAGGSSIGGSSSGGHGGVDARCPATAPMGACSGSSLVRNYTYQGCLCATSDSAFGSCEPVDAGCTGSERAAGTGGIYARLAAPSHRRCICSEDEWLCGFGAAP